MAEEVYRVGLPAEPKKRPHRVRRFVFFLIIVLLLIWGFIYIRDRLKPKTAIKQAAPVTTHISFNVTTKHYTEPDFTIDLPTSWQLLPRPVGPYQSFTWSSGPDSPNEEQIEVFEDTIPVNFAVNRALIVSGEVDHLTLDGSASDNCVNFTKDLSSTLTQAGATAAKWQGVDFLCDRSNTERDSIGTSSTDGVNTVILKTSQGAVHKFFFTYSDHTLTPDYSTFYNALQSFKMQ